MIYYVPLWMLPLVLMARAFLFVVKAFFIGVWLTGLLLVWIVRWLYDQAFPPAPRPRRLDDTRVYPSEQTTEELWPGQKRFTSGRVPPA